MFCLLIRIKVTCLSLYLNQYDLQTFKNKTQKKLSTIGNELDATVVFMGGCNCLTSGDPSTRLLPIPYIMLYYYISFKIHL